MGINPHDLGPGKGFLDMTIKAQTTKEKVEKLDFTKMTKVCASKDTIKKNEKSTHKIE